ncbi:MAG TPA: sensor histidine kinase [Caulobacteraceae bacterium]|jgi:two-component sensor histidine kinase|nr:sensor histidine kinase [Caulobacteraceae bacterium]
MSVQLVGDDLKQPSPADVLVGESNHRIANNLTLIAGLLRLQAADVAKSGRTLSAEEACLLLEEVGGRIETVGRLHRLLAHVGHAETIDLHEFLHDIAEASIGSMALAGDMTLAQTLPDACAIPAHQALPLGFVVGELITNAVKYAHPTGVKGRVEVLCDPRPEGGILIQIVDDGVGLPEGFDPGQDGGLGMRMVRLLADQLGASLSFASSDVGLTVRLLIPPARPVSAN